MRSTLSVRCAAAAMIVVLVSISLLATPAEAESTLSTLTLPVDCNLGTDCFVQQMPDVDPGPLAKDPLCGDATYNGHDGWDFRVRSMVEVARGVPVISVADGRVLRVRDGVLDHIMADGAGAAQFQGTECGNGVVIEHGSGLTSQYCHLRMGSIIVRPGMSVTRSTQLGLIGSSGQAQFPHVHFAMRRHGAAIDPLTGRFLQQELGCGPTPSGLFAEPVRQIMERPALAILATGLSSVPPTLPSLTAGEVRVAKNGDEATLAWVWAINVRQGDQFRIQIVQPDGTTMLDQSTEPLPRRMANYLAYIGRRRTIVPGTYRIVVDLLRDGVPDVTTQMAVHVKK
ncbi:M23 family metallopeptidase [Aurantimonas sp. NFXS3]|uniref:M23 family metallopeptidase n=1 Tax=Aurantimonas sp. NFXS3 TaxID=2818434 RepID=UPI003B8CE301